MKNLARIIKKTTNLSIREFCERELQTDYKAFMYRVKKNRHNPAEILYILNRVQQPAKVMFDHTFEELMLLAQPCAASKPVERILKDPEKKKRLFELLGISPLA